MGVAVGGVLLGAGLGAASALYKKFGPQPPPPITKLSEEQEISSKYNPINFVNVVDELSKKQVRVIKGPNNEISLSINGGSRDKEEADALVALSAAMTRLGGSIEDMERTAPNLIPQHQDFINSYRASIRKGIDEGFDIGQQSIDKRLIKMGLSNSSAAEAMQISLAKRRADTYADAEFKEAELAQQLKQQSINNFTQRGQLLGNQLNLGLEKSKINQARDNTMLGVATGQFDTANQTALNARQIDNSAIAGQNQAQYGQYDREGNLLESVIEGAAAGLGFKASKDKKTI